jgi:hypothetical protein
MLRACQYLLDVFCLGVKNTIGSLVIAVEELDGLLADFYQSFSDGYLEFRTAWPRNWPGGPATTPPPSGSARPSAVTGRTPAGISAGVRRLPHPFRPCGPAVLCQRPHDNADRVSAMLRLPSAPQASIRCCGSGDGEA